MPECYIRGSTIKYLRIPDEVIDMVKEEVVQKSKGRGDMRGRGGRGGRGGPGRGMLAHYLFLPFSSHSPMIFEFLSFSELNMLSWSL